MRRMLRMGLELGLVGAIAGLFLALSSIHLYPACEGPNAVWHTVTLSGHVSADCVIS